MQITEIFRGITKRPGHSDDKKPTDNTYENLTPENEADFWTSKAIEIALEMAGQDAHAYCDRMKKNNEPAGRILNHLVTVSLVSQLNLARIQGRTTVINGRTWFGPDPKGTIYRENSIAGYNTLTIEARNKDLSIKGMYSERSQAESQQTRERFTLLTVGIVPVEKGSPLSISFSQIDKPTSVFFNRIGNDTWASPR